MKKGKEKDIDYKELLKGLVDKAEDQEKLQLLYRIAKKFFED